MQGRTGEPRTCESAEHTTVYHSEEAFCSWPFNVGMWRTGPEEAVVAFVRHGCDYSLPEDLHDDQVVVYGSVVSPVENRRNQLSHARVETYGEIVSMRTRDGGETWEEAGTIARNVETSEQVLYGEPPPAEPLDFTDQQVLLTCWSAPNSADPYAQPWIKTSTDGGRTWSAPRRLPRFVFDRVQGRPSMVVRPDGAVLLMLTAKASADTHDRPVVYASFDGGVNWTFVSYITGSDDYRTLCPSPVLTEDGDVVAAVRCKPSVHSAWTEVYRSTDGGRTWSFRSRVNDTGAPGHLVRLADGRLVCVYGYRRPPYGVRFRVSDDDGDTWGREWILREDGANFDLGYPRAVELGDGRLLAAYYYNVPDESVAVDGGPRYIAATTFEVPGSSA